jgi:hypothetical protein
MSNLGLDRGEYLTDEVYKRNLIKIIELSPAYNAHTL